MVKMTLDFSSSYRAITNADLSHQLHRETLSFGGQDIPRNEVIGTNPLGNVVLSVASTYAISSAYTLSHSAHTDHIDLFSNLNIPGHPYLRFPVTVEGPPLWENYVQPSYANPEGLVQWVTDANAWGVAMAAWTNYMQTHQFKASSATLTDDGGELGQFSSDTPTLIEDFEDPVDFYSSIIRGSNFDDSFEGGPLSCTLYGGLGDDSLLGQAADDGFYGGSGNDSLFGEAGTDVMYGGNGDDRMFGDVGSDVIRGGNDADTIEGGDGDDRLFGQAGIDVLFGLDGKDSLDGGADNDSLDGGAGADFLEGGANDDRLIGDTGNDTLFGDAGNDVFSGGEGSDVLDGNDGDDFLRGGSERDTLTGGAGSDVFNFKFFGPAHADRIVDFLPGTDRIALTRSSFPAVHESLDAQEFRLGTVAADGDDRIIYDSATGRLYYDPDGTLNGASSASQVLIATFVNRAALSHLDFYMF